MCHSSSHLNDQVRSFLADTFLKAPDEILPTMTLLGDFGLDGDDADKFMIEFAKRFDVDMTGYVFSEHFGIEGMYPWQFPRFLWNAFRQACGADPHETSGLKPIKVDDLYQAAGAHKWNSTSNRTSIS
jgi:hypothetical protein